MVGIARGPTWGIWKGKTLITTYYRWCLEMLKFLKNKKIKNSQRTIVCEGKWKIFWTIEEYFSFEIESSKLIN
jgi:hypothetical protein